MDLKQPKQFYYEKYKINSDFNYTTNFLLNTVINPAGLTNQQIMSRLRSTHGFINLYLDDYGFDCSDCTWRELANEFVYMLFDPVYSVQFGEFEKLLRTFSSWRDNYDIENGLFTMHVFEIPDKYKKDYQIYTEGKYSKLSMDIRKAYNQQILNIVNKDPDMKKQMELYYDIEIPSSSEILSKPVEGTEIFRYHERSTSNS